MLVKVKWLIKTLVVLIAFSACQEGFPTTEVVRQQAQALTITLGDSTILTGNNFANVLVASQATLVSQATINSLSFYVKKTGGKLRLGIYNATGPNGGPGTKLAETVEFSTVVVGWNTKNVVTAVSLPAGSYWLAFLGNNNALQPVYTPAGSTVTTSFTYGIMPTTFSTTPSARAERYSFYATLTTPNAPPPTVTQVSLATPNPVMGTQTGLTVLGDDPAGEPGLTYTWSAVSPPAPVAFSQNGTNAAKTTTATFTKSGSYTLLATIANAGGGSVTSQVLVPVDQTQTAMTLTPATAQVQLNTTVQFTAQTRDQFNLVMASQPAFTWTVTGGGTVDQSGLFTAGSVVSGPFTLQAVTGALQAQASVTVMDPSILYHSGLQTIPNFNGKKATMPYLGSNRLVFRDRTPGKGSNLGAVFWPGSTGPLTLYTSRDDGTTWQWVAQTGPSVGTWAPHSLCQDVTGKVHIIGQADGGAGIEYNRIALVHDAQGHVTSFTAEANSVLINRMNYTKWLHIIDGVDGLNNPVLFYQVIIEQGGNGHRVVVGKTTVQAGLSPTTFSDWGDLSGVASTSVYTPAVTIITSGSYTAHNMDSSIAQNPASKDLHIFSGVTNTGDMIPPTPGIKRFRYVTAGANWVPSGGATQVAVDGIDPPSWGSASSTENYVWYTYYDSTGLFVKRIDQAGVETVFPTPEPGLGGAWGWATLSIDPTETKLWALWVRVSTIGGPMPYLAFSGFYNGSSWQTFNDTGAGYIDPWGLGGTVNWRGGIAAISPDGFFTGAGYPAKMLVIRGQ